MALSVSLVLMPFPPELSKLEYGLVRVQGSQTLPQGVERRLSPVSQMQLFQDVAHVFADCPLADHERVGDSLVGQSLSHQFQNF